MTTDLDRYDYELPPELIAQQPLLVRSDSRLMVVDRAAQTWDHRHVRDLPDILQPGDCLVLNNTRVVPARLVGRRTQTGGHWEGLFLEVDDHGLWRILCKTRGKLVAGESITLLDPAACDDIELELAARGPEGTWIVHPRSDQPVLEILHRVGRIPLPPYIRKGEMVAADREQYQTVFAETPGAVAAPTAGLHFTAGLLDELEAIGVQTVRLTLHVGPGTFRPIKTDSLADHVMDAEWGTISPEAVERIAQARAGGGRVVAIGTTSVRLLETAAGGGELQPYTGNTELFIRPPYRFRAVDVLMTNFHLPRTTLLVLVRTFGGEDLICRAYEEAIREQYRFYSYGDAMLVL